MTKGQMNPQTSTRVPRRIKDQEGRTITVDVDLGESPLSWLRSRRDRGGAAMIAEAEFLAGERLRADFTHGGLMPRTTMNWNAFMGRAERRSSGAGGLIIAETAMAARGRVDQALQAVGPEFAGLLIDVCCHLKSLGEAERQRGWPLRSAKVVLRLALAALARHYGIATSATGHDRGPTRQWGTDDYRPNL